MNCMLLMAIRFHFPSEVDLMTLLLVESVNHYNVTTTEDDRGCPAYEIGQYATLFLPTVTAFGPQ